VDITVSATAATLFIERIYHLKKGHNIKSYYMTRYNPQDIEVTSAFCGPNKNMIEVDYTTTTTAIYDNPCIYYELWTTLVTN
jgi:hypothetical protein